MMRIALVAVGLLLVPTDANAQPNKDGADKPAVKKVYKGRLPNNYGKVGMSLIQKQEVYKIQAEYKDKIEALMAQIKKLKAERDVKVHNVLTAKQKEWLAEIIKQSKARREAKDDPK